MERSPAGGAMRALARLARDVDTMTVATIPPPVLRQAALCIIDTLGCIVAGTATAEAGLALRCEPDATVQPLVGVYGTAHRRSLRSALRINGYLGDVLELNDLIGGHASIGNVTACLAVAQVHGATGARLLEAVVRGIEATASVYAAVYPLLKRFTEMGMVPVAVPSSIGAAAASACLLGLDVERSGQAMSIAGTLAGWCPAEVIFGDGGTVKPMLFGAQTAESGVTGALYAREGMTGPPALLDSPVGYFGSVTREPVTFGGWPGRWALLNPSRKLHACCGYLHSPVDALRALCGTTTIDPRGAVIEVHVAPYVADVVSKDRLPVSPNDARFHLQYCLALAACGIDVILPEHSIRLREFVERADIRAAMARVLVVPDAGLSHYHQCEVRLAQNGRTAARIFESPRGSPKTPLSEDDVIDKFRRLVAPMLGNRRVDEILTGAQSLERLGDVRPWLRLLSVDPH